MYRLVCSFKSLCQKPCRRITSKHFSASFRPHSSEPVHDVHYETSIHKSDKALTGNEDKTFPGSADVVVIGGGSVGCSTAYHLAKLGAGRVVLVEKERLTSGTTWHTAGIFFNLRDGKSATQIQVQTRDLLTRILPEETGFDAGWIETGALFVTRIRDQLDGMEKKSLIGSECGVKSWMVDPAEISRLHPLMDTRQIIGGLFSPQDGSLDPATLCTSYIKAATKYGAQVFEKCEVKDIKTSCGVLGLRKVVAVETSLGTIKTNNVVNCTGAWAPYIAEMVGIGLPQITYKHTYVITQTLPGIETTPHIRDTENRLYHKRQGDVLLFGGYELDPDMIGVPEKDFSFGLYDMDWEKFEPTMEGAIDLVPSIKKVGIRSTVCGPESFTPDNMPLMGDTPDLRGFYVGSAFNSGGMMMGGGAGRQLAHWVVNGEPEIDMRGCDINRFTRKHDETWVVETCHDSFTTRFSSANPNQQKLGGRNLRTTPLTEQHVENGAYLNCIHGWEVPAYFMPGLKLRLLGYDYFGSYGKQKHEEYEYRDLLVKDRSYELDQEIQDQIVKESKACYDSAGIVDVSHLSKFSFAGSRAASVVRSLFTTDVTALEKNSNVDTLMLNKKGEIVAHVSVTKFDDESFQVTAASELQDFILRHINHYLLDGDIECAFEDITDKHGLLRVIGPKSAIVLGNVCPGSPMESATCRQKIADTDVVVSRITSSELQMYEIQCPLENVRAVYNRILSSDTKPCRVGMRALNSVLRENGVHSPHSSYLCGATPCEARMTELCTLDGNRDYVGKDSFEKMSSQPSKAYLVHLKAKSDFPILPHDIIWRDGAYAGMIEDAAYGCKTGEYHVTGFLKMGDSAPDGFLPVGNFMVGRHSKKAPAAIIED